MKTSNRSRTYRSRSRQHGLSTLLIAILLLAIVTIITIFAARFGIFEQRMSANDYRYKMAFQVAEAGLNQSMEFIKASTTEMLSTVDDGWLSATDPAWQPCTEALPADMDIDPCLAEPNESRRDDMYRYVGNSDTDQDGILPVEALMPALDMGDALEAGVDDHVDEFAAEYESYATLCRLDISIPASPRCALDPATGDTFYVTIVSRGSLPSENATVTVKQSFGTFRTLGSAPDAPLIASGTVLGLGSAEIVPNPNAGGFNVPVSIWSPENVHVSKEDSGSNASFATCQLGEWLTTATPEDALNGVCEDCKCGTLEIGYGMLSAGGSDKVEGADILDIDGGHSEAVPKVVDFPPETFPDDLFAYVFSVPNDDAEDFLNANATPIDDCEADLSATSSGLFWLTDSAAATCILKDQVGTLAAPVALVSDKPVRMSAGLQFFGIIYVRDIAGANGFDATGNGQVYGSVIVDGEAEMSGGPQIIYNDAVLQNIRNSPNFLRYGPIPGSWSDTLE